MPIFQTSTYAQEELGKPRQGYEYSRTDNPTRKAYETYAELGRLVPNTYFAGRLATYRYLNMDQIVDAALDLYETIRTDWLAEPQIRTAV